MPEIVLTDHQDRDHLLPLTHTRPVAGIRIGLWTLAEKWKQWLPEEQVTFQTQKHLSNLFPQPNSDDRLYINGGLLPDADLVDVIMNLKNGQSLIHEDRWLATKHEGPLEAFPAEGQQYAGEVHLIDRPWKIFQWNAWALEQDIKLLRSSRSSADVPSHVTMIGEDIFVEEGAELLPSTINTSNGPVYIGKNAVVMEGSMVRGGLALMDHSQLKMGAKIYGATTIGPHSKVGGEVNNCVIFGYSNKAHDGFIGNSVVGEWCNLGADTNTSNLKNNYAPVKMHSYALGRSESTGSQFCGLVMGDHAKAGINTMFNTGTVCGVFANVFGGDFPHRVIPDFAWGGAAGFKNYRLADALQVAERVMSRRGVDLTEEWIAAYSFLHEHFSKNA